MTLHYCRLIVFLSCFAVVWYYCTLNISHSLSAYVSLCLCVSMHRLLCVCVSLSLSVCLQGFPSSGVEGMYRNPLSEVQRFFKKRHDKHYKVSRVGQVGEGAGGRDV